MPDTDAQLPVVGKTKKSILVGGGAVVGILVIIYYVRKKNSSSAQQSASQASSSTDQYPPDGTTGDPNDPYSTDPSTGQTYGNETVGSGGTYGAYESGSVYGTGTGNGIVGYDSSGSPVYAPGYQPTGTSGTTSGPPFANNASWSNWVIAQAQTNNPNIDIAAFTDALGLYLGGQPLTPTQKQYVFDAQAIGGEPPVAGSGGYPPAIRSNPSSTSGTHQVAVPNVIGSDYGTAYNRIVYESGLKISPLHINSSYEITGQTPAAGAEVEIGSTVTLTYVPHAPGSAPPPTTKVAVPNVVGENYGTAYNKIVYEAGLKLSPTGVNSNWRVTSQSPSAGTQVNKGTTVTVKTVAQKATRT